MPKKTGTKEQEATREAVKRIIRGKDIPKKIQGKALVEIDGLPGDAFANISLAAAFVWEKAPSGGGFWSNMHCAPNIQKEESD